MLTGAETLALGGCVPVTCPGIDSPALGMAAVSLIYLILGTMITPWLWADPLGPLLKILPGLMLALLAVPLLESR